MAEHGTRTKYLLGPCRCDDCTDANTVYMRERRHRLSRRIPDAVAFDLTRDLLAELFPNGLTSPDERERHDELIAS